MTSALSSQDTVRSSHADAPRLEGALKVTGQAKYTSDIVLPSMLYAVPVCSTIASGKVLSVDAERARAMLGVKAVLTHETIGSLFRVAATKTVMNHMEELRPALADTTVSYYGQYVALVVAETFEQATAAAFAVRVQYEAASFDINGPMEFAADAKVQSSRGDSAAGFQSAAATVDQIYETPTHTHNPIELHATVAVWEDGGVTLYETSQGIVNHRLVLAQTLGLPLEKVRVISHFLGSGFGSKLYSWTHSALAADASRQLKAPVKLVLTRQMMFQTTGNRPRTRQRLRLGATREGGLQSLRHDFVSRGSLHGEYVENCRRATPVTYSTPNLKVCATPVRRNVGVPTTMRGPGATPGVFAVESAMDELAVTLNMEPVELRLHNEPTHDESSGKLFSSRHLKECLQAGAQQFGWERRTGTIGSMRRGDAIVGWGVASCAWDALRFDTEATVELLDDGTARVASATQDIGTGTYSALAQMVSEMTGLPVQRISVSLGDTILPAGPTSGGSRGTASLVNAVCDATRQAMQAACAAASELHIPSLAGVPVDQLTFHEGTIKRSDAQGHSGISFQEVLQQARFKKVTGQGKSKGIQGRGEDQPFSFYSYGAHFCEVTWQPDTARLRVTRFLSVIDAGRIINPALARGQIEGGVVMGLGMALFEATVYDDTYGAPLNSNLAEYMLPTNADIPPIEVDFLDYPDTALNQLGARGLGEIGTIGTAAAVTSAVYNATGKRIRTLPIRIENLL